MGGAVFTGHFQLDEAGAHPVGAKFRRTDLEVEVGLAAGFGDLAPAGADFVAVAVAGIDAMIGGVFAHLVHGDDNEAGGDVEGFERAGEVAVCGFGEGAKGDSHLKVSYAVDRGTIPAMSPAKRPQRRAVHLKGRSATEHPPGGEICLARNGHRPGEIFPTEGLNGPARDLSDKDMQGLVLDEWRGKKTNGLITRSFHRRE